MFVLTMLAVAVGSLSQAQAALASPRLAAPMASVAYARRQRPSPRTARRAPSGQRPQGAKWRIARAFERNKNKDP